MLSHILSRFGRQRGDTLLEVLISLVLVCFGMLGFAGFISKVELTEMETHQRTQADVVLGEMVDRIRAISVGNSYANAANYVLDGSIGTGDERPASCPALNVPATAAEAAAHDLCEWSNALKGASEKKSEANIGGMIGARACIIEVQPPSTLPGSCAPGIYQVTVVWQGLNPTKAPEDSPANRCGKDQYGDEKLRRVLSERVVLGLLTCN